MSYTVILPDGTTMTADESGFFDCPYNRACHCKAPRCDRCGWNPVVDMWRRLERRRAMQENTQELGGDVKCTKRNS